MAYVDDVMFSAPTRYIERSMKAFQEDWACKIVGIVATATQRAEHCAQTLVFLSITIEAVGGGVRLHQKYYLETNSQHRNVLHGRANLPGVEEGNEPPVSQDISESLDYTIMM